jgi:hypothetical protein
MVTLMVERASHAVFGRWSLEFFWSLVFGRLELLSIRYSTENIEEAYFLTRQEAEWVLASPATGLMSVGGDPP